MGEKKGDEPFITLVDAAWLLKMAEGNKIIPRHQELPPEAHVKLEEMELWGEPFTLGCLVLSYAWQYKGHPDPKGEVLKSIAFVLRAFVDRAKRYDKEVNGTPFDFQTKGLLVRGMAANTNPYDTRGWCVTEMRMSSMVKDQDALLDLSKLSGLTESQKARPRLEQLVAHGRGNRIAPLAPEAFEKLFRDGWEKGDLRFTSGKVDLDLVIGIYEKSFVSAMTTAKVLQYGSLSWGDSQAEELAAALRAAGDPVAGAPRLQLLTLSLQRNQIRDNGVIALAGVIGEGLLVRLSELDLFHNEIGDEGALALAEAVKKDRLQKLERFFLAANFITEKGASELESLRSKALPLCTKELPGQQRQM